MADKKRENPERPVRQGDGLFRVGGDRGSTYHLAKEGTLERTSDKEQKRTFLPDGCGIQ